MHSFQEFLRGSHSDTLPELGLCLPRKPFAEFCVAVRQSSSPPPPPRFENWPEKDKLAKLANQAGLQLYSIFDTGFILSTQESFSFQDKDVWFGGLARYKHSLICGGEELEENFINPLGIIDTTGEWEMVLVQNGETKQVAIHTDFFGTGKFFYSISDGWSIFSTSYHLCLLTKQALGLPMTIDRNYAAQILKGRYGNAISHDMEIADVYILPTFMSAMIDIEGRVTFQKTALESFLGKEYVYSDNEYEDLLYAARDELIGNTRAVLERSDCEKLVIGLTGGYDSRLLVAAAANMPNYLKEKIRVHSSNDWAAFHTDFRYAVAANDVLNFPWCDLEPEVDPTVYTTIRQGILPGSAISWNMGRYWCSTFLPDATRNRGVYFAEGGFGENITRRYQSKRVSEDGTQLNVQNQRLKRAILETPGSNLYVKAENHYILHRNRHHFQSKYTADPVGRRAHISGCTGVFPLVSKSAAQMKLLWHTKHSSVKIPYDLMYVLYPSLLDIPYAKKTKPNSSIAYKHYKPNVKAINSSLGENAYSWRGWTNVYQYPERESLDNMIRSEEMMLSALKYVINRCPEFESICERYYTYYTSDPAMKANPEDVPRDDYIYGFNQKINRVLMLYYQLKISEEGQSS